jgi:hypothetical protein
MSDEVGRFHYGWEAELLDRIVLRLMCDDRGDISFLFGPWGATDGAEAIRQIESGERTYTLQRQDGSLVPLVVMAVPDSKRLSPAANGAGTVDLGGAVQLGA